MSQKTNSRQSTQFVRLVLTPNRVCESELGQQATCFIDDGQGRRTAHLYIADIECSDRGDAAGPVQTTRGVETEIAQ